MKQRAGHPEMRLPQGLWKLKPLARLQSFGSHCASHGSACKTKPRLRAGMKAQRTASCPWAHCYTAVPPPPGSRPPPRGSNARGLQSAGGRGG